MSWITRAAFAAAAFLYAGVSFAENASPQVPQPRWLIDDQARCYVYYTDAGPVDAVTWSGSCADKVATGGGTATFMNGGRFVQSVSGAFQSGAPSGFVRVIWEDGRSYEGQWHSFQPNGQGILTRKDGTKVEGEFVNGEPKAATPAAPNASLATAAAVLQNSVAGPASQSAVTSVATPAASFVLARRAASPPSTSSYWWDAFAGEKLGSVDGSTISLASSEGGLVREIDSPAGTPQKTAFSFVNDKQGTITDSSDPGKVLGVFRVDEKEIHIDYADGHSEVVSANASGGVSMGVRAVGGSILCLSWYPAGHTFSTADRQAALAQYAVKLGISQATPPHAIADSNCDALTGKAKPQSGSGEKSTAAAQESTRASQAQRKMREKTASLETNLPVQPILVRTSQVHLADSDALPDTDAGALSGGGPVVAGTPAQPSTCLSVEANGADLGFRNHCSFPVQFAYCVLNGSGQRYSCDQGAITGSVSGNGYDPLFAENQFKEADHDFRWVACEGDGGNVVPRLVRADPPQGRCVRVRET